MAAKLLTVMLMMIYICEGALLRKSAASDFLHRIREERESECFAGGCSTESSEAGELIEDNQGYERSSLLYDGVAAQKEKNYNPEGEAVVEEGSGM